MNVIRKSLLSTASFGLGYFAFADVWEQNSLHWNTKKPNEQNIQLAEELTKLPQYQKFLERKEEFKNFKKSTLVPRSHHENHVPLGLLFGPEGILVDPVGFQSVDENELYMFCHVGSKVTNFNNKVHNGLISTFVDELLCFCGFNKLPSRRGVTGKLHIDFIKDVNANSNLLISCKVKEVKGRKVVIEGNVKKLFPNGKSELISTAECILVEPKWFKYLSWVPLF